MTLTPNPIPNQCLILELKANPSPVDRWGGTPLDDALRQVALALALTVTLALALSLILTLALALTLALTLALALL